MTKSHLLRPTRFFIIFTASKSVFLGHKLLCYLKDELRNNAECRSRATDTPHFWVTAEADLMWIFLRLFTFCTLMLWHPALHLREELPLLVLPYCKRANSFFTERVCAFHKGTNTSIFPAYPPLSLTISPSTPAFPTPGPDPSQTASVFRVHWVHLQQNAHSPLPCFSHWKDNRAW